MSATGIESVLSKAMSEPAFAEQLLANPDQALTGFELTAEELANIKTMSRADFDKAAQGSPEERKSFALTANHNQTVLHIRN